MDDPATEHAVFAAIHDCVVTMKELLEKRRHFPALIMLYSATDILGSLVRPKSHADTSGDDFKKWAGRYFIGGLSLPATVDDLWAARCGLLHTDTPGSRSSRSGKAREIHYLRGDKDFAKFMQQENERKGELKVVVDIDVLFDAFFQAVIRFKQDIKTDAAVRDTVFHHAKAMFSHYGFKMA